MSKLALHVIRALLVKIFKTCLSLSGLRPALRPMVSVGLKAGTCVYIQKRVDCHTLESHSAIYNVPSLCLQPSYSDRKRN